MEFFRGMRGTVHVAFEEGAQAQWLYDLLVPIAHRVFVCDLRGERRRSNKADRRDADDLSRRLLAEELRPVYHGSSIRHALQELTRTYLNVVEDSTRAMQRVKSLFRARAIPAKGTRVYAPEHRREWLAVVTRRAPPARALQVKPRLIPAGEARSAGAVARCHAPVFGC